jgi:hypothetical protein
MWTAIQLAFAGLGGFIWHWGLGIGLLIICGLAYFLSDSIPVIGPFLTKFRKDILWIAAGIAIFMAGQVVGAKDEAKRCTAKTVVIEKVVGKAVEGAKTSTTPDPYNSPEN